LKLPENIHGLAGKGYEVSNLHFHPFCRDVPLCRVKIKFRPLGVPQLPRADKEERGKQ